MRSFKGLNVETTNSRYPEGLPFVTLACVTLVISLKLGPRRLKSDLLEIILNMLTDGISIPKLGPNLAHCAHSSAFRPISPHPSPPIQGEVPSSVISHVLCSSRPAPATSGAPAGARAAQGPSHAAEEAADPGLRTGQHPPPSSVWFPSCD